MGNGDAAPTEAPAAHVIEALCRVMRDLPAIAKTIHPPAAGQEQGVKYPFRGIEEITPHTQDLFARHGIVLAPLAIRSWDIREITVREKPWTDDRITVAFRCYGPGGPTDYIDLEVPGIGRDNSDKGSNKAMTAAMKYALGQMLQIAGDDPDATREETDRRPIDQRDDLSIPRGKADAYVDRALEAGLNADQVAALVHGVTEGRTDIVYGVMESEYQALKDATKRAVDARRASRAQPEPDLGGAVSDQGGRALPDGAGATATGDGGIRYQGVWAPLDPLEGGPARDPITGFNFGAGSEEENP